MKETVKMKEFMQLKAEEEKIKMFERYRKKFSYVYKFIKQGETFKRIEAIGVSRYRYNCFCIGKINFSEEVCKKIDCTIQAILAELIEEYNNPDKIKK